MRRVPPRRRRQRRARRLRRRVLPLSPEAVASRLPRTRPSPPAAVAQVRRPRWTRAHAGPAPATPAAAGAAAAAVAVPGGGTTAASAAQLLANPNLSVPASARALFASGSADPRLLSVLSNAASHHTIVLGDAESVVDPVHAQAVDIVAVDGQPVGPANVAARDLITEIAALDPSVRPNEIGTPWAIESPGFFTDPAQAGRLHLAFVSSADFQPGAGGAGAAAANVGPAPATPAAAGAAQAAAASLAERPRACGTGRDGSGYGRSPGDRRTTGAAGWWRRGSRGAGLRAIDDRQAARERRQQPRAAAGQVRGGFRLPRRAVVRHLRRPRAAGGGTQGSPHGRVGRRDPRPCPQRRRPVPERDPPGQRNPARRPGDVRRHRARRDRHPRRRAGHPHDRRQHRAVKRQRDDLLPELGHGRRATEVRRRAARGDGGRDRRGGGAATAGGAGRTAGSRCRGAGAA